MKNTTKRIIVSVLTLVLTVVAVGTTTFAWFSLSNVASISNISGSVQGGEGLEVRIVHGVEDNESTFKTNLSDTDWENFLKAKDIHSKGTNPFKFGAVSTDTGVNFNHLKQVPGTSNLTISDLKDGANKQYLEFELEFRSLEKGTINLTKLDFDESGSITWSNTGGTDYDQLGEESVGFTNHSVKSSAANAARVGFYSTSESIPLNVFQETLGVGTNGYTETDGVITGNNFSGIKPVTFGQYSYLTDSKNAKFVTSTNDLTPLDIDLITIVEAKDLADSTELKDVEFVLSDDKVDHHHTARITVRIWIEGWDADAYDTIFLQKLNVNMSFAKKEQ